VTSTKRLGILVGGGPAPGINSVIGTATIRACLSGYEVVGIHDGYKWLLEGDLSHTSRLSISDTSRIHFRGGSHIGISRAGPADDPARIGSVLESLRRLAIDKLIVIGGDGTGTAAATLQRTAGDSLAICHVPKTIDNDLDLPQEASTFGFQTARHHGVDLVHSLMVEARTTARWFFAVTMGRKAGHLALGIGKSVGATLTLIPEEFLGKKNITTDVFVDILAGSVLKRMSHGRFDGIAILAEGLVTLLDPEELASFGPVSRDVYGRVHLGEIQYGEILKSRVTARLRALGLTVPIVAKNFGYELRCVDPIPFDMELTRDLGYGAAKFLTEGGRGCTMTIQHGRLVPVPLENMLDSRTKRMRIRMVDIESDRYKIARTYMIRLKREDLDDPTELAKVAAMARLTSADFREQFGGVVEADSIHSLAPPAIHAR
jgi:ATP-dependent phosphofructokinase / diphosphate-dependent phosphofructokinase